MPSADPSFGWQEGVAAYLIVAVAAFLAAGCGEGGGGVGHRSRRDRHRQTA